MKFYDTHGRHLQDSLYCERSYYPSPGALGYRWCTIASNLARQAQREWQYEHPIMITLTSGTNLEFMIEAIPETLSHNSGAPSLVLS